MELSFLSLFLQASWLVKLVMCSLVILSVTSWALIFRKSMALSSELTSNKLFEAHFWNGGDLLVLYQRLTANQQRGECVLERTFEAAFKEFMKHKQNSIKDAAQMLGSIERAMRASIQRDLDNLESSLSFIATVGSISPYIGLLGTVWGIMTAFSGLAMAGQATLSQVAPGIAEALVATAIGLFAAIPAVIAYNRFNRQIEKIANQSDAFGDELSNILLRQS